VIAIDSLFTLSFIVQLQSDNSTKGALDLITILA